MAKAVTGCAWIRSLPGAHARKTRGLLAVTFDRLGQVSKLAADCDTLPTCHHDVALYHVISELETHDPCEDARRARAFLCKSCLTQEGMWP